MFDELFCLDLETLSMKLILEDVGKENVIIPKPRNSHTLTKLNEEKAYLFGGADQDGPMKDLHELDLTQMKFRRVQLDESEVVLPRVEMHTAHIYGGTHLLILGGRKLEVGQKIENIQFSDSIYAIELSTGKVSIFGTLPSALGSHVSALISDEFLVIYGGTNGLRFFDSILRYDIAKKEWTLMTKQPEELQGSNFFSNGRIATSYDQF